MLSHYMEMSSSYRRYPVDCKPKIFIIWFLTESLLAPLLDLHMFRVEAAS